MTVAMTIADLVIDALNSIGNGAEDINSTNEGCSLPLVRRYE